MYIVPHTYKTSQSILNWLHFGKVDIFDRGSVHFQWNSQLDASTLKSMYLCVILIKLFTKDNENMLPKISPHLRGEKALTQQKK